MAEQQQETGDDIWESQVHAAREEVTQRMGEALKALNDIERAARTLVRDLYDVEVAEGGGPEVLSTALSGARTSLAAIEGIMSRGQR